MNITWIITPVIAAFIGWVTNWVAIKMLFHPRQPKKILGITFHGIFPKRQRQFAENIGRLVGQELLSFKDIEAQITSPENLQKLMPEVERHIDDFLRNKLSTSMPVISMFIGDKTIGKLKATFMEELEILFPKLMKQYTGNLKERLDLEQIVVDKVSSFSSDKLEQVLNDIMKKEFRFVEVIGAVLGFIVGVVNVILNEVLN